MKIAFETKLIFIKRHHWTEGGGVEEEEGAEEEDESARARESAARTRSITVVMNVHSGA